MSKTNGKNLVANIGAKKRAGARRGSSVSLSDWSPDADKASSSSSANVADSVTLIHFNDVYNIEQRPNGKEPIGGAARFKTRVDSLRDLEPLILFSGDALNPSNSQSLVFICVYVCLYFQCMFCVLNELHIHTHTCWEYINPVYLDINLTLHPVLLPPTYSNT